MKKLILLSLTLGFTFQGAHLLAGGYGSKQAQYDPNKPTLINKVPDEILRLIINDIIETGSFTDIENLLWTNRRFRSLLYKIIPEQDRLIIQEYRNILKKKNNEFQTHWLNTATENLEARKDRKKNFTGFFKYFFINKIHTMDLKLALLVTKIFLEFAPKFGPNISISLEKKKIKGKDWIIAYYDLKNGSCQGSHGYRSWELKKQ